MEEIVKVYIKEEWMPQNLVYTIKVHKKERAELYCYKGYYFFYNLN